MEKEHEFDKVRTCKYGCGKRIVTEEGKGYSEHNINLHEKACKFESSGKRKTVQSISKFFKPAKKINVSEDAESNIDLVVDVGCSRDVGFVDTPLIIETDNAKDVNVDMDTPIITETDGTEGNHVVGVTYC